MAGNIESTLYDFRMLYYKLLEKDIPFLYERFDAAVEQSGFPEPAKMSLLEEMAMARDHLDGARQHMALATSARAISEAYTGDYNVARYFTSLAKSLKREWARGFFNLLNSDSFPPRNDVLVEAEMSRSRTEYANHSQDLVSGLLSLATVCAYARYEEGMRYFMKAAETESQGYAPIEPIRLSAIESILLNR